jgi:hypothetical protein
MSERPSASLRNQRKHFVKCVDCSCQTLPQNAPRERLWAAAATLYITGRVNDGALCFQCANKRREVLGLPIEKEPDSDTTKVECERAESAPASGATPKKIRINNREYIWDVSTLDSLIVKWREQHFHDKYKNLDARWSLVVINNRSIHAIDFSSVPISHGDEIFIVLGRGRCH